MDKNTIWGLLVMAAVFFAFMYFTGDDKKQAAAEEAATEQTAAQAEQKPEPLSDTDMDFLRTNLRDNGTLSESEGVKTYTLNRGGVSLTLTGDSVAGTVNVDGQPYTLAQINSGDASMTTQQRRRALDSVRSASARRVSAATAASSPSSTAKTPL